jgi:hypothetical protein
LEGRNLPDQLRDTAESDPWSDLMIRAWNMLGGLEWAGIDRIADMLGIDDRDALVLGLITIRKWKANQDA